MKQRLDNPDNQIEFIKAVGNASSVKPKDNPMGGYAWALIKDAKKGNPVLIKADDLIELVAALKAFLGEETVTNMITAQNSGHDGKRSVAVFLRLSP